MKIQEQNNKAAYNFFESLDGSNCRNKFPEGKLNLNIDQL